MSNSIFKLNWSKILRVVLISTIAGSIIVGVVNRCAGQLAWPIHQCGCLTGPIFVWDGVSWTSSFDGIAIDSVPDPDIRDTTGVISPKPKCQSFFGRLRKWLNIK